MALGLGAGSVAFGQVGSAPARSTSGSGTETRDAGAQFRPAKSASDALKRSGAEHFYNMEYEGAIHDFELCVKQNPDDPSAANHLLTTVLYKELYRVGALDAELYAGNSFISSKPIPADPVVRQRIKDLTERALQLSEVRLQRNPNDVDALYERGITKGSRAIAMALMDKAWFTALRSALGARRDHERVLELDPNFADAKMVVGIHNYILGSLPWTEKVAVSMVGLGGSKTKGIQYLYDAINHGHDTNVDAKIVLALFLRREQRYPEAIALVEELNRAYPRSYLFALEYANLLKAAGHGPEAVAAYRKLLADAHSGKFEQPRVESAEWGLGEALRGQRDFSAAAQAYESVAASPLAIPELQERANLAAGEMYDLMQQRQMAIRKYELVIASAGASPPALLARKYIRQPYRQPEVAN